MIHSSAAGPTQLSPVSANIQMLSDVFNDADVKPNLNQERCALFDHDEDGDLEVDDKGINTFYQSEGYLYKSGHGRDSTLTLSFATVGA